MYWNLKWSEIETFAVAYFHKNNNNHVVNFLFRFQGLFIKILQIIHIIQFASGPRLQLPL